MSSPLPQLTLLNPGPVNVHPDVRAGMTSPDQCHRESEPLALLARTRRKAAEIAGGNPDDHTAAVFTGSGTAALEAAFASIVPPTGRILILDNGHYGERLWRIVKANGVPHQRLEFGWTNPIDLEVLDRTLAEDPGLTHVGLVQHETSTGQLNPLREIGEVVARHGRQLAVDAISSLGSERFDLVADHVDWVVATANKCLEGLPGVSFVAGRRDRFEALKDVPARGFYLDLYGNWSSQEGKGVPAFTPAVQVLTAFEVALDRSLAEGVEARGERYLRLAELIRAGLTERGCEFLLPPEHRANSCTNVYIPDGIAYTDLHDTIKAEGYVIYATQEQLPGVFRVANMGQLTEADVTGFLEAFDRSVAKLTPPQL